MGMEKWIGKNVAVDVTGLDDSIDGELLNVEPGGVTVRRYCNEDEYYQDEDTCAEENDTYDVVDEFIPMLKVQRIQCVVKSKEKKEE